MNNETNEQDLVEFFKALGEPNRLRIVGLLSERAHTVEQLGAALGIGVSTGSDASCGGYVTGNYAKRWATVKAYYSKAKEIGATVIILVSDLWGEDPACATPRFPGDGGDWTDYNKFMTQLISDAQALGMTGPDVRWDLQNEPDVGLFRSAPQSQWLEMWKRGYQMVRAAIPNALIEGPSNASGVGGQLFNAFLDYVKA